MSKLGERIKAFLGSPRDYDAKVDVDDPVSNMTEGIIPAPDSALIETGDVQRAVAAVQRMGQAHMAMQQALDRILEVADNAGESRASRQSAQRNAALEASESYYQRGQAEEAAKNQPLEIAGGDEGRDARRKAQRDASLDAEEAYRRRMADEARRADEPLEFADLPGKPGAKAMPNAGKTAREQYADVLAQRPMITKSRSGEMVLVGGDKAPGEKEIELGRPSLPPGATTDKMSPHDPAATPGTGPYQLADKDPPRAGMSRLGDAIKAGWSALGKALTGFVPVLARHTGATEGLSKSESKLAKALDPEAGGGGGGGQKIADAVGGGGGGAGKAAGGGAMGALGGAAGAITGAVVGFVADKVKATITQQLSEGYDAGLAMMFGYSAERSGALQRKARENYVAVGYRGQEAEQEVYGRMLEKGFANRVAFSGTNSMSSLLSSAEGNEVVTNDGRTRGAIRQRLWGTDREVFGGTMSKYAEVDRGKERARDDLGFRLYKMIEESGKAYGDKQAIRSQVQEYLSKPPSRDETNAMAKFLEQEGMHTAAAQVRTYKNNLTEKEQEISDVPEGLRNRRGMENNMRRAGITNPRAENQGHIGMGIFSDEAMGLRGAMKGHGNRFQIEPGVLRAHMDDLREWERRAMDKLMGAADNVNLGPVIPGR